MAFCFLFKVLGVLPMSALGEKGGIFAVYFEQLRTCAVILWDCEVWVILGRCCGPEYTDGL